MSKTEIADIITTKMLSWGFQLKKQYEYKLVFGKKDKEGIIHKVGSSLGDLIKARSYKPEWLYSYYTDNHPQGIRVIAEIEAILNPDYETRLVLSYSENSEESLKINRFLKSIKDKNK
jgi:hypothetical protein